MKFRKKPVVIDAVRLTRPVTIETLEGNMRGEPGDWLITGVAGEQYACKHDVFMQTYVPVDEEATVYLQKQAIVNPTPAK